VSHPRSVGYDYNGRRVTQTQLVNISFYIQGLWHNVDGYYKAGQTADENTIRRMRFAYWITKAINTHSEYVILIAFPLQKCSRERASVRLYVHFMHSISKLKNKNYYNQHTSHYGN